MKTMLHWSPTRQLHFHHPVEEFFPGVFEGATNEAPKPAESWLPATEGWIQDGTYTIQFALPGVDPKEVTVSLMDSVLTVKGERKAQPETTGKEHFVHEAVYGTFERSVTLPEGVDAAQVEAKYTNGILEVRIPTPKAATPRTIEIKAA
jgi:HSP20 family protein